MIGINDGVYVGLTINEKQIESLNEIFNPMRKYRDFQMVGAGGVFGEPVYDKDGFGILQKGKIVYSIKYEDISGIRQNSMGMWPRTDVILKSGAELTVQHSPRAWRNGQAREVMVAVQGSLFKAFEMLKSDEKAQATQAITVKKQRLDREGLDLFKNLISISSSLLIEDLAQALDLSRGELLKQLVKWKDFGLKIDGDKVIIDNKDDFISHLEKEFAQWERQADGKV